MAEPGVRVSKIFENMIKRLEEEGATPGDIALTKTYGPTMIKEVTAEEWKESLKDQRKAQEDLKE